MGKAKNQALVAFPPLPFSPFSLYCSQFIGIVMVAEPAFPAGKRFWRAMRTALASPPDAWMTRPDSS
jgi:hypothetical protein